MKKFCLDVWEDNTLVMRVVTGADEIPVVGQAIDVVFTYMEGDTVKKNPNTEFIKGEWGKETAHGTMTFVITGRFSSKKYNGLPVVEAYLKLYEFYLLVHEGCDLALRAKTSGKIVPSTGDKFEVDFERVGATAFLGGTWVNGSVHGVKAFTAGGRFEGEDGLPVIWVKLEKHSEDGKK